MVLTPQLFNLCLQTINSDKQQPNHRQRFFQRAGADVKARLFAGVFLPFGRVSTAFTAIDWIIEPVVSFICGVIGGITMYILGFSVGELTALAWYRSLDEKVKIQVNGWLKETSTPFGY